MDTPEQIRQLLAQGKLEKSVAELAKWLQSNPLRDTATALQAEYKQLKNETMMGTLSFADKVQWQNKISGRLLMLLKEAEDLPAQAATAARPAKQLFISYNHADQAVALQIRDFLLAEGFNVLLDIDAMKAGEDIGQFITKSVRESAVTLSLVSRRSLLSAWVAMETLQTFNLQQFDRQKQFIACYLDAAFFAPTFVLEAADELDEKLKALNELAAAYAVRALDTRDLNNQKTRLLQLRNNLDEIVRRLRESLCIEVNPTQRQAWQVALLKALD